MKTRGILWMIVAVLALCGCGGSSSPAPESMSAERETPVTAAKKMTEADAETPPEEEGAVFRPEDFPDMDGSTSLAPLGVAAASVLLGETREQAAGRIDFHRTTQSYRNLMEGFCQLVLASEPNPQVFDEMKNVGFDIAMEEIATEALVFVVNRDNPVDSLSSDQIRQIYSGEITNWKEVGGEDREIRAFQRNSGAGSQVLMEKLLMGEVSMMEAPEGTMVADMGSLIRSVENYDNSADAIGYTVYYYADEMRMAEGLKILAVDDVVPAADTIRDGSYPLTNPYYCAISAEEAEDSPARIFYDWIVSEDGQRLVSEEGYVSVLAVGASDHLSSENEKPKRKNSAPIPNLEDGDYKAIYPFVGDIIYSANSSGYSSINSYLFGMVDDTGCIIADPTYTDISLASRYDLTERKVEEYPFWVLSRSEVDDDGTAEDEWHTETTWKAVATLDGSAVTACKYQVVIPGDFGVFLATDKESREFMILDRTGQVILTERGVDFMDRVTEYTWNSITYAEGLFGIGLSDGYYYMNMEGELVLGPYGYGEPFSQDRATVHNRDYTACQVIDRTGRVIIPEGVYDTIGVFDAGGLATAFRHEDSNTDSCYVIDTRGQVILETGQEYPELHQDFISVDHWEEDGTIRMSMYDRQGQPLKGEVQLDLYDSLIGDSGWLSHEADGERRVSHIFTGKEIPLPEDTYAVYQTSVLLLGQDEYQSDPDYLTVSRLSDSEGREVWKSDLYSAETGEKICADMESVSLWHDHIADKTWIVKKTDSGKPLWVSEDGKEYRLESVLSAVYGDQILTVNDRECRYLDLNGKEWFRYSLLNSCGD